VAAPHRAEAIAEPSDRRRYGACASSPCSATPPTVAGSRYRAWAELLRRTSRPVRCGARMRLVALVTEPQSVASLRHRGEPTEPPARAPPRDPPYFKTLVVRRRPTPESSRQGSCPRRIEPCYSQTGTANRAAPPSLAPSPGRCPCLTVRAAAGQAARRSVRPHHPPGHLPSHAISCPFPLRITYARTRQHPRMQGASCVARGVRGEEPLQSGQMPNRAENHYARFCSASARCAVRSTRSRQGLRKRNPRVDRSVLLNWSYEKWPKHVLERSYSHKFTAQARCWAGVSHAGRTHEIVDGSSVGVLGESQFEILTARRARN
jgi:hypothetical protein